MSIYDELQPVASEILSDFSQGDIKLIQYITPEDSTPDNPKEPVEKIYQLKGTAGGPEFKYLKEGFVTASTKQVTVGVIDGVKPSKDDFIEIDGERFKVLEDVSTPAAGTRVVWKFLVQRGG